MHHLPRFLSRSKQSKGMDRGKKPRKPKLERRNALNRVEYDASSSSSSLEDSTSSASLHTRSLDRSDRTSFRIEGIEGEIEVICKRLGFSGPEDFAISESEWAARTIRSSSDILPRSRLQGLSGPIIEEEEDTEQSEAVAELREIIEDAVRIGDGTELTRADQAESSGCCVTGGCGSGDGGGGGGGGGNGIKGIRPSPVLKPPPAMRVLVVDNGCSTWDLMKDFAPDDERGRVMIAYSSSSDEEAEEDKEEEEEKEEIELATVKREVVGKEEIVVRGGEIAELSDSFTASNDEDSSSSTTVSPNGRVRPDTSSWEKGIILGRGSFGSVFEGIAANGVFFAVKEVSLLDQGSQGKQSVYQLEQEIALLSQFEHENIVQYYGTAKDESKLYIFLELVSQGSLLKLYQRYHLLDSQVSSYTRQILHGLKYLHDRNVVHRDVKCANILVDVNGSVKLADFGLAKATKLNDLLSCKGTAFWMAPEVVNGKNQGYGLPADIWSLGCTVLEMLTSQIPYSGLEGMAALFKIGKGEPPPVADSLSRDARDFVLQCLRAKAHDRPTAAQLLDHPFVKRPLSTSSGSGR
ncbi:mitogen-activated protein kinase kinase kinase 1-like [Corylus avellana]|uniref:mitogen-activated protein kinase kinase kinase 1-like n=1 Tax=Corylus avellana TaxID=13451 RepID=UPI00286B1CC2|nr:mitogen-activated protein kinase kinase kinase 1-like [Corylus avellana]